MLGAVFEAACRMAAPLQLWGLRMSDPITKGVKRSSSRPASRRSVSTSKSRSSEKGARPKPMVKRDAGKKAPARKATKAAPQTAAKTSSAKSKVTKASSVKVTSKEKPAPKAKVTQKSKAAASTRVVGRARKNAPPVTTTKVAPATSRKQSLPAKVPQQKRISTVHPTTQPRQHTIDESAALLAFQRAYKEFARGKFSEARDLFKALIEKYPGGSDVTARARTYLSIAESRLRTEIILPKDADALYDRGVIELNRGEFVAAQEMFERALKREPEGAHIHYGLAATRARLGSIDAAMFSLQKAIDLQPALRVRAQHDADLTALRNVPEFDQLISSIRP
jgi:tetratricopeptide (TPR) repeat protein